MNANETAPAGLCRPAIEAAGLPQRPPLILERERNLYPFMVARLAGGRGSKGRTPRRPLCPWPRCRPSLPAATARLAGRGLAGRPLRAG